MPYQVYDSKDAVRMVDEYKALKEQIAELEGSKASKSDLPAMKRALESKGQTIEAHLKSEIDGVRRNFLEHATKVENYLGQCVGYLRTGAEAFEKFNDFRRTSDRDLALYALPTIQATLKLAQDDAMDYGVSWKDYRSANFTSQGLDAQYAEYFNNAVGKLMAEQKPINVKIDKMEQLVEQAEALKKVTEKFAAAEAKDLAENRKEAAAVAKKMEDMFTAFKNANKGGVHSVTTNFKTIDAAAKNKALNQKAALKNYEGLYTNALNSVKAWKTALKGMESVLATAKKGFDEDDLKDAAIKKSLQEADQTISEAKFVIKSGETGLIEAAKDLEVLRKRMVK